MVLFQVFLAYDGTQLTRVVLDTQWLAYHIIGPTLAGNDFADQFQLLSGKSSYNKQELELFYKDIADFPTLSELLQSLDLMVTFDDKEFIIPCKVQKSNQIKDKFKNGRTIFCVDEKSMLSPTIVPTVQARIMKAMGSRYNQPIVSRGFMQFLDQAVGLTKEEEGRDAINFAVVHTDEDTESCFNDLEKITGIVVTTIYDLSPGTAVETGISLFKDVKYFLVTSLFQTFFFNKVNKMLQVLR